MTYIAYTDNTTSGPVTLYSHVEVYYRIIRCRHTEFRRISQKSHGFQAKLGLGHLCAGQRQATGSAHLEQRLELE